MENGVDLLGPGGAQQLAGLGEGQLDQLYTPGLGQLAYLLHDREAGVGSDAYDEPRSRPWDRLIGRERGVARTGPGKP